MAGEPFVGEIRLFGFNFAPRGWAKAQGQILPVAQNQTLFALYGTTYGGNGSSTFALPDLSGRVAVGQGQFPGGSTWQTGTIAGSPSVTLTSVQMPMHTHGIAASLNASQGKASESTPTAGSQLAQAKDSDGAATPVIYVPAGGDGGIALGGLSVTIQPAGGSQPVQIQPPSLGLNYSVALLGVYPSRN